MILMIKKKTTVTTTYGSINSIHVTIQREEKASGELYTTSVIVCDKKGFKYEMSKNEAHTLCEILTEVKKDGILI
jgi:hypothetical protein